ncbi:cell division protein FtsZ [Candidatus Micrarchaeota archaeon CG_4_10_14_0_2_um_filter_55_9]|nr:MAG: cell division protein FtsZ [Candidatus Micrarchaeota archaeon CG09_land_8_20_14_0_10_55_25]PIZ91792.1 MAG: cell division protein FtsZ [Candidatus Micrarchaeota archaeon CG_4_10_14_0_2_um_filter_55_9]
MQGLVEAALRENSTEKKPLERADVQITVVGVGGGGTNTINRLSKMGIKSAKTIAVNTDAKHLKLIQADRRLLIGGKLTKGLGAGGFPEVGMKCAEQGRERIAELLAGSELVFITAGMGGGTGTGAAPVIADVAKKQGAIVIGMVTYPFELERARLAKADWGLDQLRETCDTVVVIDNNRLVSYVPNLPMNQAFAVADTLVARSIKGITDTVMLPSLMNIDFADLRMIMGNAGVAMISVGEGKGTNKVEDAVESTLKHPLLDVDYHGSKGALVLVNGGPQLTLGEAVEVGERITESFDNQAYVKWGARIDPDLGDKISVTSIITGVTSPHVLAHEERKKAAIAEAVPIQSISF